MSDTKPVATSNVVTVKVSPGQRVVMRGHVYTVMGTESAAWLLHRGVLEDSPKSEHLSCGANCEIRDAMHL